MSRERRIPRARDDYYSRHPLRVCEALERADLDFNGYALVSFFVDRIDAKILSGGTNEVALTLEALAETITWPLGREALRQKLHELRRAGWIDFDDLKQGQRRPWVFRLGRAAIDGESEPIHDRPRADLQAETPVELEVSSNESQSDPAANPHGERDSVRPRPPTDERPRAELSRAEREAAPNGDSVDGEGTQVETHDDRLIAAIAESRHRDDALAELHSKIDRARLAAERNGEPPVRVERADGGLLVWTPEEPFEGEQGIVADAQALVDAGIAEW